MKIQKSLSIYCPGCCGPNMSLRAYEQDGTATHWIFSCGSCDEEMMLLLTLDDDQIGLVFDSMEHDQTYDLRTLDSA